MSGENELARQIRDGVYSTDIPTHVSFIESHTSSPGIPDINIAHNSRETFIELKCELKVNKLPAIRASQVRWFKKRAAVGARTFLFAKLRDNVGILYLLIPGKKVKYLPKAKTIESWKFYSCEIWQEMNWYIFLRAIGDDYYEQE